MRAHAGVRDPTIERGGLVVVADQRADAGVAVRRHRIGVGDLVGVAVLVFEFGESLRPGAVEDAFEAVRVVLGELLRRLEPVGESTVIGVRFVSGQNEDGCVCHDYSSAPSDRIPTAVVCSLQQTTTMYI